MGMTHATTEEMRGELTHPATVPHVAPARATAPHLPAMAHALWWGLFAVGGMVAAVLMPIHVLIQGILGPLGVVPYVGNHNGSLAAALTNPLVKLYLFVLISLPLFHAAHRLRFLIFDLGFHAGRSAIAYLFYGAAILGTLLTVYILIRAP